MRFNSIMWIISMYMCVGVCSLFYTGYIRQTSCADTHGVSKH